MNPTNERKKTRARVRPPATPPVAQTSPEYPVGHEADYAAPPVADTSPEYPVEHVAGAAGTPGVDASPQYPVGHMTSYGVESPAQPVEPAGVYEPPTVTMGHDRSRLEPSARTYLDNLDMGADAERTLELREEQLVARKDLREAGEVRVRTVVEEVPGRLEVEALREEVEIEHVPMGQIVSERQGPWEEDDMLVVPVYEEQLVVVKRLVLKEHLRIRRVSSTERQLFEDTLRRDRLVVEDPSNTHLVHERYPDADGDDTPGDSRPDGDRTHEEGGLLGQLMRKALG